MIETEQIPLFRSGAIVTSLASSFGHGLRETRLTSMLGYLISLKPMPFLNKFNFKGNMLSLSLEMRHEANRSDIHITTTNGTGIVEAKIETTDPFEQSKKYNSDWKVLLTSYIPTEKQHKIRNLKYLQWKDIADILMQLIKDKNYKIRFLSSDLLQYLKEHNMILKKNSIEIYAREINEESTLALFLHGKMYGCDFIKDTPLLEALYFAPHFGQRIANNHPGITEGISYIAKINKIKIVETKKDLENIINSNRKKSWLNKNIQLLNPIFKEWNWSNTRRYFLFLGDPRLAFNPSVKKDYLQKGKGYLNKHFLTFDELFKAWNGEKIY